MCEKRMHWQKRFETIIRNNMSVNDASHDLAHFQRVYAHACQIAEAERTHYSAAQMPLTINDDVLQAACYFHDIVSLPKNHPDRSNSSMLAAQKAIELLSQHCPDFPAALHPQVKHSIEAHSFSAGIRPETIEARIVQDADRLESLGAIGLARVFYIAGRLDHALFEPNDPLAEHRSLDDSRYTLDHFQTKLLTLPSTMQTHSGKQLAMKQAGYLIDFIGKLVAEIEGNVEGVSEEAVTRLSERFNVDW